MLNTIFSYSVTIEGNDIDAKNARNLKIGELLNISRLDDEEDTFEILISTKDLKPLEMLSYNESLGLAPFLDNNQAQILSATVTKIDIKPGKSRARDKTTIYFDLEISYDETSLEIFKNGTAVNAFIPLNDAFYSLCLYRALDYDLEVVNQTHLNRYEFEVDLDDDSKQLFDMEFSNEDYFYSFEMIFKENFATASVLAKIYSDNSEYPLSVTDEDCETFLTLINHYRIFGGEDTIDNVEILA